MDEYNMKDKMMKQLTIQVVMDILERLMPLHRIVTLSHYYDTYDIEYMANTLEMSGDMAKYELQRITKIITRKCDEYEQENKCQLCQVDKYIIYEAFLELFKQDRYSMTVHMKGLSRL